MKIKLFFSTKDEAIKAAFGIECNNTLYVTHSEITDRWILSDFHSAVEYSMALLIRPTASLDPAWLNEN